MLSFKTCGSNVCFRWSSTTPPQVLPTFLGFGKRLEDAKLAIADRSDLTDIFKVVNELDSDLAKAMDEFEILRKQARDLHPR
jgi:hypothetical protein